MRIVLNAEARLELREATRWYSARSVIVARRFTDAYRHAKGLISNAPRQWPEIEPGVRRVLLRGFPYSLIYELWDERVVILAVKHDKRQPGYWHDR